VIAASIAATVEIAGARDHGGRDVDAVGVLELTGKRLCRPPQAAAKIERPVELRDHACTSHAVEH
jgi:hypothetical protein